AIAPDPSWPVPQSATLVWNRIDAPDVSPISAPGPGSIAPPEMLRPGTPPTPDLAFCDPEARPTPTLLSGLGELAVPNLLVPGHSTFVDDNRCDSSPLLRPIHIALDPRTHPVPLPAGH